VKQKSNRTLNLGHVLSVCALTALASACGASNAGQVSIQKPGPAGLSLRSGTLTPHDMAFGRPQALAKAHTARVTNIDEYLLPDAKRPALPAAPAPAKPQPAQLALAPAKPLELVAVRSEHESTETASMQLATAEPPKQNADMDRYSARDRQSSELQKYRGGDAIVITASTLVIVLLIVLLLILLT
jgi:hypothetical protein